MKKNIIGMSIKRVSRAAAKKKLVIILSGLLFLSMAYNIWWVGYERDGSADTIKKLNRYIEMSRDIIMKQQDVIDITGEALQISGRDISLCGQGLPPQEGSLERLVELADQIETEYDTLKTMVAERTEFANSTGLEVTYIEEKSE